MNKPIIKIKSADLLAYTEGLLGFQPADALVVLPVQGNQLSAVLRIDLPEGEFIVDPEILLDYIKEAHPTGVILMLYTESDETHTPRKRFVRAIMDHFNLRGVPVGMALLVTPEWWGDYGVPSDKRDLAEAGLSNYALTSSVMGINNNAAPQILPPNRATEEISTGILQGALALSKLEDPGNLTSPECAEPFALLEKMLVPNVHHTNEDIINFTAYMHCKDRRDALIAKMIMPGVTSDNFGPVLQGQWDHAIDQEPMKRAREMLAQVLCSVRDELRPPLLTAMAVLTWHLGQCSIASSYLTEVLRIDAGYRLAVLMALVVERGIVPKSALKRFTPQ